MGQGGFVSMSIHRTLILVAMATGVSGCASTMGFGEGDLSCPYPEDGPQCMSLPDAYEHSIEADRAEQEEDRAKHPQQAMPQRMPSGTPILTDPEILRVWIGPWEDASGRFHDQSYIYTVVRDGDWLLKRNGEYGHGPRFRSLDAPDNPLVIEDQPEGPERMSDEQAAQSAAALVEHRRKRQ